MLWQHYVNNREQNKKYKVIYKGRLRCYAPSGAERHDDDGDDED